jgi:hypothetical protein
MSVERIEIMVEGIGRDGKHHRVMQRFDPDQLDCFKRGSGILEDAVMIMRRKLQEKCGERYRSNLEIDEVGWIKPPPVQPPKSLHEPESACCREPLDALGTNKYCSRCGKGQQ